MDSDYHLNQFHMPKRSTVAFCDFLESSGVITGTKWILDIGAGMGGVVHYLCQQWRNIRFVGIEKKVQLVEEGNRYLRKYGDAAELIHDDLYLFDKTHKGRYDGIISVQSLSWLPRCEEAIIKMIELDPIWIAITSLFYDGPVSCDIHLKEYHGQNKVEEPHLYRIYSLERIQNLFACYGFSDFTYTPFDIDIDIPRMEEGLMQTYTEELMDGRRLQISGPVMMPWHFIVAKKSKLALPKDRQ